MEAHIVQLLNALALLQETSSETTHKVILMQAESVIVSLENRNAELSKALTDLLNMPDYDRKAATSKVRRDVKRRARLILSPIKGLYQ
jgi:hypothetical protein